MKKTYDNLNDFYADAVEDIHKTLARKMRLVGLRAEDVQPEIDAGNLIRDTTKIVGSIITEHYIYKGILLLTIEWTPKGMNYKDINKDERTFDRNY